MPDASVVLADDHPPTRLGARRALEDAGFQVIGEAANAGDAVSLVEELDPDVALLDIHMPGNGIDAARRIARSRPHVSVVMLTVSDTSEDLFDALRAGAVGYLLKDTDPDRLPLALEGVLAGEAAIPRRLVARLMDEFRVRRGRRLSIGSKRTELTEREAEVLDLMVEGLTTAAMAGRMFVSQVTVRTHIAAVLRKLEVTDRGSAVKLVRKGGQ